MSESNGTVADLDIRYRPSRLEDVVGQPEAIDIIRGFGTNIPRTLLFTGMPGSGKTTLARIVSGMMGVSRMDYQEINCGAIKSAIDLIRDLSTQVTAAPMMGTKRVWVLDEIQTFSKSKGAAEALLKVMEDCPSHAHIFLCTTDPQRVIAPIRSRCVKIGLKAVPYDDLTGLVNRITKAERIKLDERVIERIVESANGSPRDAVKELQKVISIADTDKQLAAVGGMGAQKAAFDLIKELMPFRGSPNWNAVAKVLEDIKDEEPEGIRAMLLSVARTGLLKGGPRGEQCYRVICSFDKPFYDRNSGNALLAAGCWEVCTRGNK